MMSLPKCELCKGYRFNMEKKQGTCEAFPEGIPESILWDSEENECNNGIKFEEDTTQS